MHELEYIFVCFIDWVGSLLSGLLSKEALSALVGASIAGLFSFMATKRAHVYALEKADNEEIKVTRQTLKLMLVEVQTAWKIYKEEYAPDLNSLPIEAPHLLVFPLGENVFTVYDSAPSCMANLPSDISTCLVRLYMRMKGMVAMIKLNNEETLQAVRLGQEQLLALRPPAANPRELEGRYILQQAVRMKMETNAQSMRALAVEIETLYTNLISLSEEFGVVIDN